MEAFLLGLFTAHPELTAILAIVGSLRLTLKPTFAYLHTLFQSWGLVAWDQKETAVEQSKVMQVIYFLLDYLGSIKVPVKQDPSIVPAPKE